MREEIRQKVDAALNRLSHAYIIQAPAGEETLKLTKHLASAYVCTSQHMRPCGECAGCRKAQGDIHPDVIYLSTVDGKRNITVEQVRHLRTQAYIRPNEAPRKVLVIKEAETMNESAQNALLKVLEDGPAYLSFLLVTEQSQQLLPTIRSRCEILNLTAGAEGKAAELDEDLLAAARELAHLLIADEERALVEYAAQLEQRKWEKDTLPAFFDAVETVLQPELLKRPKQMLALIEHLKRIRRAALFNVGTGHLFGWLTAESGN